MVIFSHNRLPWQQYNLFKTPIIFSKSGYNSKTSSVTLMFYYGTVKCNFLHSLKRSITGIQSHLNIFENLRQFLTPLRQSLCL